MIQGDQLDRYIRVSNWKKKKRIIEFIPFNHALWVWVIDQVIIKRNINLSLSYSEFPAVLEGYSNASWITSASDNKSTSGRIFTIAGWAISWASKKQTCIAH